MYRVRAHCSAGGDLSGFYTSIALCSSAFYPWFFLHQVLITSRAAISAFFSIMLLLRGLGGFSFYLEIPPSDGCEQKRASISCRFRICFAVLVRLNPTLVIRHRGISSQLGTKNTNCWDSLLSLSSPFPSSEHLSRFSVMMTI